MRIEERFAVSFPSERVWAFLHDTEAVVRCLPGAELIGSGADGHVVGLKLRTQNSELKTECAH